jgi:hypothetical protein
MQQRTDGLLLTKLIVQAHCFLGLQHVNKDLLAL